MAVDSCDGNTKAVALLANQAQKDILRSLQLTTTTAAPASQSNAQLRRSCRTARRRRDLLVVAAFSLLAGQLPFCDP